jgi:hypothetical protein
LRPIARKPHSGAKTATWACPLSGLFLVGQHYLAGSGGVERYSCTERRPWLSAENAVLSEKLESYGAFLVKTQGLDAPASKTMAKDIMSKLPAWKDSS